MPKMRLTQLAVDRLKPPTSGRVEYWDSHLPAFGLRVSAARRPGGEASKTWVAMYRVHGRLVRETLGTLATIPKVDQARDLARASMAKASGGINPVAERQRRAVSTDTLATVFQRYLIRYAEKQMRPASYREVKRAIESNVIPTLGARPIREITRRDVRDLVEAIVDRGSPIMANRTLAHLRAMLNWAVGNDLIEVNPCAGMKLPAPKVERDRALNDDEIRLFWRGCDKIGWPFGPLYQLLLLTGQRRDELAESYRAEFDLDNALWTLPRERVKNDKAHLVHLSPLAIEIIGTLPQIGTNGLLLTTTGETPIAGFSVARLRLEAAMQAEGAAVPHFTIHDLRRSAATGMAAIGVPHHVLDRVLNHTAGKISGVARIYNRHEYLPERKAALDAWSRHVESLVRDVPSNVEPIEKARRRRSA